MGPPQLAYPVLQVPLGGAYPYRRFTLRLTEDPAMRFSEFISTDPVIVGIDMDSFSIKGM
jgi:hypothetical protein